MTEFEKLQAEIPKMTVEEFDERFDDCNHCRKAYLESEAVE